jgi:hypothetical protein
MSIPVHSLSIHLPGGFDAQSEFEMPFRGYLPDVVVELADGTRHRLAFVDLSRLEQTLEDNASIGRPYYAEPGLVVLPEVTLTTIEKAVHGLCEEGYFDCHRMPSGSDSARGDSSP